MILEFRVFQFVLSLPIEAIKNEMNVIHTVNSLLYHSLTQIVCVQYYYHKWESINASDLQNIRMHFPYHLLGAHNQFLKS